MKEVGLFLHFCPFISAVLFKFKGMIDIIVLLHCAVSSGF
jgi:hypothetical protein